MLKGIPSIFTPDLLKVLMEMGHGDEIVIGDGNFPASSCARRLVRCDGHGTVPLINAILKFFPVDAGPDAVCLMGVPEGEAEPDIWKSYRQLLDLIGYTERLMLIGRFEFYERSRRAYAVVSSGETAIYGNIILRKGVVLEGVFAGG